MDAQWVKVMACLGTVSMKGMGFLEASYHQDCPIAFPHLVDVILPFGIS